MLKVSHLAILAPPYRAIRRLSGEAPDLHGEFGGRPGVSLVWRMKFKEDELMEVVRRRPGGMALIVILPDADRVAADRDVLRVIETCRPQSVLPYHVWSEPNDLMQLARRPPDDLAAEVTDYLTWRGVALEQDGRHLIRRTIEMSSEIQTVAALARALYQSRRALGRRFLRSGLPVASHWLHFGRILRAAIRLQSTNDSLFTVACDLGYPDGFALSNQMKRLTGLRPTTARDYLGWEWILEAWIQREASAEAFSDVLTERLTSRRHRSAGGPPKERVRGKDLNEPSPRQRRSLHNT